MIKINFQEPDTENWKAWRTQCENEQRTHNEAFAGGQKPKVKDGVYQGKDYNIKPDVYMSTDGPFHGKCAYCESPMVADQDGQIEHFRPKNAVSNINFEPVKVEINGEIEDHFGYYWLCYDYKNLLPSCIRCNQKRKHGEKFIGKHTRFPVDGDYAVRPGEEVNEVPLLLNPVFDDPKEHLELKETGVFQAKDSSDEGQMCIDVFGLNIRESLVEGRIRAFKSTRDRFTVYWLALRNDPAESNRLYQELMDIKNGKEPYSAGGRLAFKRENLPDATKIGELIDE